MDYIEDWVDYVYDFDYFVKREEWDNVSLRFVSIETTEKYKNQLNWAIVASNWEIDQEFYQQFRTYLQPYTDILQKRIDIGLISVNLF